MNTANTFSTISNKANHVVENGLAVVERTADRVVDSAHHATDSTVRYIRQEPVKAVLVAAAAGALVAGLLAIFGRSRHE